MFHGNVITYGNKRLSHSSRDSLGILFFTASRILSMFRTFSNNEHCLKKGGTKAGGKKRISPLQKSGYVDDYVDNYAPSRRFYLKR